jgi:hypothetical protein
MDAESWWETEEDGGAADETWAGVGTEGHRLMPSCRASTGSEELYIKRISSIRDY